MSFEKIKKRLGLGCMRLKMDGENICYDELEKMVDCLIDSGFNYFDTAHGYIGGKSEICVGDCISSRHKREDFVLADKLSAWCYNTEDDIDTLFEKQLSQCKVDYFDFYLLHSVNVETYPKYKETNAIEHLRKFKNEGKIKHIGISFHETAPFLDMVLSEIPDIEVVQLQINYLDYDDPSIQSKECYETAVKHGKKVIVMEPVKGGALVNLPPEGAKLLDSLGYDNHASFALGFVQSFPEVFMVLSGMGNMEMVKQNIKTFNDFVPFSKKEYDIAQILRKIIRDAKLVPCTACSYCTELCPQNIPIPGIFGTYNEILGAKMTVNGAKKAFPNTLEKADSCIKCGKCESVCPQKIAIREKLSEVEKRCK
ncbi:MAG: Fe-S oxidoreductase [Ruminococcaceae bacterium]|nr:Fe-S oxidoreductase [Oscillospiraceae bacterium]